MKKSLTLLCNLSLLILFSSNHGTPEAPVEIHELVGKTLTIKISHTSTRDLVFTGDATLTITFESDGKTASWSYITEQAAKSGIIENIKVTNVDGKIEVTSGENFKLILTKEREVYKTAEEGKIDSITIPTNLDVKILQLESIKSINSFVGHTFFGAGNCTAAQLVIDEDQIEFKYFTNYKPEGHSLNDFGDTKVNIYCNTSEAKIENNKLILPQMDYGEYVGTFDIINSSTLRMVTAEKICLNLIK